MKSLHLVLAVAFLAGCEAGPSAFDRSGSAPALPDSADVAALPPVPTAAEVETLSVATGDEAGDASVVPGPVTGFDSDSVAAETAPAAGGQAEDPTVRFPRPEHVRGLYLNAWAAGSAARSSALIELARRTEINAFVIDIKDATGYISHPTSVPVARAIGATGEVRIRDLPGLLDRLEAADIYPIARIVVVKDPLLAEASPHLAVQDTAGGVWVDSKGIVWLNAFDRDVWDYHVAIAREVAEMGFPEIQWDYVRFPDAPAADHARSFYPGQGERSKADAIRAFLAYSREHVSDLDVRITADVFGVTTSAARDVGIGQVWESFIDVVDVALPMVYPSHYWQGSFQIDTPNAYPYEVVRAALSDAVWRSSSVEGAGSTRPWLQDFSLGEPIYEAPEVRAQIQATYDAGIQEWILWNPGSRYTESALEPTDGFEEDPLVRFRNEHMTIPAMRRIQRADSIAAARADSIAAARRDSIAAARRDSIAAARRDSIAVAR